MGRATVNMAKLTGLIVRGLDVDYPDMNNFKEVEAFIGKYKDEYFKQFPTKNSKEEEK